MALPNPVCCLRRVENADGGPKHAPGGRDRRSLSEAVRDMSAISCMLTTSHKHAAVASKREFIVCSNPGQVNKRSSA